MFNHIIIIIIHQHVSVPPVTIFKVSYDKSQAIPSTVYNFIYLTGCELTIHIQ